MARDLADDNVYHSQGGKIPLKWTAPEVGGMCVCTSVNCEVRLKLSVDAAFYLEIWFMRGSDHLGGNLM